MQPGDIVIHTAGSVTTRMVIVKVHEGQPDSRYECKWSDGARYHTALFSLDELEIALEAVEIEA